MAKVRKNAKQNKTHLEEMKRHVKDWFDYFKSNIELYHSFRMFVFKSSLSEEDVSTLQSLGKPVVECNIMEAYISRLRGEFSKQEPSINVNPKNGKPANPQMISFVEGYMRALLFDANNHSFEYNVYTDLLSGGFSVMKCWTDYESDLSMDQIIKVGRARDVTQCGFDILSHEDCKGDGRFCFDAYPKLKEEVEEEFGVDLSELDCTKKTDGFNFSYTNNEQDIVVVCDFYEKKKKKTKLFKLADGQVLVEKDYDEFISKWNEGLRNGTEIRPAPAIVDQRNTLITTIHRYRFVEDRELEHVETDYNGLPLIFVDGNSIMLRDGSMGKEYQFTRPYLFHAQGMQRIKNFALSSLGNELENMIMHKWMICKEGIPPENVDAYKNNQQPSVVVFNAFKDNNPQVPLPPPQVIQRTPIPPEIANTFQMADSAMQMILGSFDSSLGINNNQLSGVAIQEGATQSNAAAMPYIVGFLKGLNQLAQVVVDLIPKYIKGARTLPIVDKKGKRGYQQVNDGSQINLDYPANHLDVRVEAGVNFAIQKSRAMAQIIAAMQASEEFAAFINSTGLDIFLKNMEFQGVDELIGRVEQWLQMKAKQMQQQAQQPNPMTLKAQELQLKGQELQQDAQQNQAENQLDQQRIANETMKIQLTAQNQHNANVTQMAKAHGEQLNDMTELSMKADHQHHSHNKDVVDTLHAITQSQQQHEVAQNAQSQAQSQGM